MPEADEASAPVTIRNGVPGNSGILTAIRDLVVVVPFQRPRGGGPAPAEHRGGWPP